MQRPWPARKEGRERGHPVDDNKNWYNIYMIRVNTYGNICQRALKIMSPVDLIIISFLGIYPKKINRKI